MADCPYSGMTIRSCKSTDLCDCFDFPEPTRLGPIRDADPGVTSYLANREALESQLDTRPHESRWSTS